MGRGRDRRRPVVEMTETLRGCAPDLPVWQILAILAIAVLIGLWAKP